MAKRFYLLPKIGDGQSPATAWRPKYVSDGGVAAPYATMNYGPENLFLVVGDFTDAEHQAITANVDVLAFPQDLDEKVSSLAIDTVITKAESANLPMDWLTDALTWRQALKTLIGIILIVQRFEGQFGKLFAEGVTLDQRVSALGAGSKAAITATAESFGMDASAVKGTMPIREALKVLGDQAPSVTIGGETF